MNIYAEQGWFAVDLFHYIELKGYPRTDFLSIPEEAKQKHQEYILNFKLGQHVLLNKELSLPDAYYLIYDEVIEEYPILVRKKDGKIQSIDYYNSKHFLSSVIKNVFLVDYEKPEDIDDHPAYIKTNVAGYLFYYYTYYNNRVLLNIEEVTEGVIMSMSNCYMMMIERELTTYRNYPELNDYINNIQIRLNMERMHNSGGIKKRFNIRS